jgi:hypothetical protein
MVDPMSAERVDDLRGPVRPVMVRPILALLAMLTIACAAVVQLRAEEFLSVLDDMPLMPGLTELRDQAADFQTPEGRIIDGSAAGSVDARAVSSFYDETLPALGWRREAAGRFVRNRERLVIAVAPGAGKGAVVVRFSVRPQAGAPGR